MPLEPPTASLDPPGDHCPPPDADPTSPPVDEEEEDQEEETEVVTMLDVLKEETELEANADAGTSGEQVCLLS